MGLRGLCWSAVEKTFPLTPFRLKVGLEVGLGVDATVWALWCYSLSSFPRATSIAHDKPLTPHPPSNPQVP